MPLFFLLSGFCLTLGYGRKKYTQSTVCCGPYQTTCVCCCTSQDEQNIVFDSWNFYKGRFIRILPVYYACFFYALPLIYLGYYNYMGNIGAGSFLALFFQQSIVMVFGLGPNSASWTVSTLFFFYWFYPRYVLAFCIAF